MLDQILLTYYFYIFVLVPLDVQVQGQIELQLVLDQFHPHQGFDLAGLEKLTALELLLLDPHQKCAAVYLEEDEERVQLVPRWTLSFLEVAIYPGGLLLGEQSRARDHFMVGLTLQLPVFLLQRLLLELTQYLKPTHPLRLILPYF